MTYSDVRMKTMTYSDVRKIGRFLTQLSIFDVFDLLGDQDILFELDQPTVYLEVKYDQ